jgi:hypothetical protein
MIFRGPRASVPTETTIHYKAPDLYEHSHNTDAYILTRQSDGQQGYVSEGIFATTGSNTFVGNQIISGNLDVTGTLTANQLNYNYTATGSIYMTGSISTVNWIDFVTSPNPIPPHQEGRIHWEPDRKTLQIDTEINNFMIAAGHVNVVRGKNTTNQTLTKGTVVYITGNSGQFASFGTASFDSERNSAITFGIIAQDIAQNNSGYAVMQGEITGVNTNGFAPGTLLYLSSSGNYSDFKPHAPLHQVRLGQVVVASTNGIIQVKIDNGWELDELHDVRITTASLKDAATNTGGSLVYRTGSLWQNNNEVRLAQSTMILATVSQSLNFANDTDAAAGGVPAGGLYHTNGTIKIRLV